MAFWSLWGKQTGYFCLLPKATDLEGRITSPGSCILGASCLYCIELLFSHGSASPSIVNIQHVSI